MRAGATSLVSDGVSGHIRKVSCASRLIFLACRRRRLSMCLRWCVRENSRRDSFLNRLLPVTMMGLVN